MQLVSKEGVILFISDVRLKKYFIGYSRKLFRDKLHELGCYTVQRFKIRCTIATNRNSILLAATKIFTRDFEVAGYVTRYATDLHCNLWRNKTE